MNKLLPFVFLMIMTQVAWSSCTGSTPNWSSTPDSSSVQTCVNNASTGDTITLSGGSVTYTSTVNIGKGITIIVASGQTVTIANSVSGGTVFAITNTGNNFVRVSGGVGSPDNCKSNGTCGLVINSQKDPTFTNDVFTVEGPVNKFRIDHVKANQSDAFLCSNCGGAATGPVWGVIDHSYLTNFGRVYFAQDRRSTDGNNGSVAWGEFLGHEAAMAGSNQMVYFEDNTITWTVSLPVGQGQGSLYGQYGGKVVYRYNTVSNFSPLVDAHGDNPGYGTIFYELYNNTITEGCTLTGFGCEGKIMYLRGGQFLIHDNAITGASTPVTLTVYFSTDLIAHRVQNTFIWNNTVNGSAQDSTIANVETANGGYPKYFLRAPTTGDVYASYTPYTYPHPLVAGGGGGGGTPAAPSGLTASVQ